MQKKSLWCALIVCFFGTLVFPLLTNAAGTLLPPYTGVISPVPPDQWLDPSHGFNQDDLDVLIPLIEKLQLAARDKYGKPVVVSKINKNTIFVHKFVNKELQEDLKKMDSKELLRLYRMVGFLQIQPLIDAIAAKLAGDFFPKDIDPKVMKLTTENLASVRAMLVANMDEKCGPGSSVSVSESLMACLQKNMYFFYWKCHEQTIADSLGDRGQPHIYEYGAIKFNREEFHMATSSTVGYGITSLHGLDLIDRKDEIRGMDFDINHIMGDIEELGSSFPEKPFSSFPHLERVYLRGNCIFRLSEDLFQSLPCLQEVDLYGNRINRLPGDLFQSSPQLTKLSLGSNPLEVIETGLFKNLDNLKNICFLDATIGSNAVKGEPFQPLAALPRKVWMNFMRVQFKDILPGTFTTMPENVHIDLSPSALTNDRAYGDEKFADAKAGGWYISGGSIGERMFNWVTICRCSSVPYYVAIPDPCTVKFLQAAIAMVRAGIPRPKL